MTSRTASNGRSYAERVPESRDRDQGRESRSQRRTTISSETNCCSDPELRETTRAARSSRLASFFSGAGKFLNVRDPAINLYNNLTNPATQGQTVRNISEFLVDLGIAGTSHVVGTVVAVPAAAGASALTTPVGGIAFGVVTEVAVSATTSAVLNAAVKPTAVNLLERGINVGLSGINANINAHRAAYRYALDMFQ
jgi:hypothetical protein